MDYFCTPSDSVTATKPLGPVRTCISCGTKFGISRLMRFAVNQEGVQFDLERVLPGRGAYVCKNDMCLKKAFAKNLFCRAFRTNVKFQTSMTAHINVCALKFGGIK